MRFRQLRGYIERFINQPAEEMGRWARLLRSQLLLCRYCAKRLYEHDVMSMSAALSFRTIFAMIPVIVLAVLVAKSIGALENSKASLRSVLDASGFSQIVAVQEGAPRQTEAGTAPSSTERRTINLANEIEAIVDQVERKLTFSRIGPIGGVLLIWTAIGLLSSMESALNRIFGAPRGRSFVRRMILYWSAMTLGPISLALASYVGRSAVQVFESVGGISWVLAIGGRVAPVLVGTLVVAALYKMLPTTWISFRSALSGALVAMILWLIAKWAFAVYVERLVLKGNLYGLLGVLPLFFLWLYYSWLLFLFGAELAHTADRLTEMEMDEQADRLVLGPSDLLAVTLGVIQPYQSGQGPVSAHQVAGRLKLPDRAVQILLDRLLGAGVLCSVKNGSGRFYMPAKPADQIQVREILGIADPRGALAPATEATPSIARAMTRFHERTSSALSVMTLKDMLKDRDS